MPAALSETPVPSLARTVSGDSGEFHGYAQFTTIRAQLNVTASSGTSPTLDVLIEDSLDDGANWNTVGTFAQKVTTGREVIDVTSPFGDKLRIRWTITGTSPSFTFAVDWIVEQ